MRRNDHSINRAARYKPRFVYFIFAVLWIFFVYVPASAHKAVIFAWVDGDTIHTQSKFSAGKRVKGGEVVVFGSSGTPLLKGKTDENGMFSFKVPQKTELKVVLNASMGHMAVWKIPADQITGAESESNAPVNVEQDSVKTPFISAGIKTDGKVFEPPTKELGREEIQEIIDASLDKKLAPIFDMLAKTYAQGPRLTEILGGLGYIIGLVGLALYFSNRRRKE